MICIRWIFYLALSNTSNSFYADLLTNFGQNPRFNPHLSNSTFLLKVPQNGKARREGLWPRFTRVNTFELWSNTASMETPVPSRCALDKFYCFSRSIKWECYSWWLCMSWRVIHKKTPKQYLAYIYHFYRAFYDDYASISSPQYNCNHLCSVSYEKQKMSGQSLVVFKPTTGCRKSQPWSFFIRRKSRRSSTEKEKETEALPTYSSPTAP